MTRNFRRVLWAVCLTVTATMHAGQQGKGYLLIIGGGEKPEPALKEFVSLSASQPILVITSASGVPEESGPYMVQQFKQAGAQKVDWLHIKSPEMANEDSTVTKVSQAGGIFFTGGVQERLMNRLGGTRAEKAIMQLYFDKGGIIGGTSAGAAVMSQIMITGNELINKDSTNNFVTLQKQNVETKRGFGFLDQVIIDQHFVARKRHNRLISLVLENPKLLGVGIDENTAILVEPSGKFRVYGDGSVIVYDARKAKSIRSNEKGRLAGKDIKMDILFAGDEYRFD